MCSGTRDMLLLRNLILGLFVAGFGSFFPVSTARLVEVRIPVWNVGNIIGRLFGYVNGQEVTKPKRTRPKKVLKKEEYWLPSYGYYGSPPLIYYHPLKPYYTHSLYPPSKRPITKPIAEALTEPLTDPLPTEPLTLPTKPTEEVFLSESLNCILHPYLSACQAATETSDNGGLGNLDPANHQPKLTIVSKPLSLESICDHFPELCRKPEGAQFLKLTDSNGKPWLLISGLPEA